jgi:hypothetical protein
MFSGRRFQRALALAFVLLCWSAALNSASAQENDRHVLHDIFGGAYIAENVGSVRHQAAALSAADRFEFLARWILPGNDHPDFRMAGEFTPTDPSPLTGQRKSAGAKRGPELVSPVFDLLDAAAESGRLTQLRERVAHIPEPEDELNRRGRAALLALIELELGRPEAAEAALTTLQSLVSKANPAELHDLWPETLVVHRGAQRFSGNAAIGDLLSDLYSRRTMQRDRIGGDAWHTHIVALSGRHWHLQRGGTHESFEAAGDLADWVPVVRTRARSRGDGCAYARWVRRDDEAHHVAGHQEEYLYYRIPLRGDFVVAADIGAYGTTQFFAAGGFFGPKYETDLLETGTFRRGAELRPFEPPFSKFDRWVRCRADFRGGAVRLFLNGRLVREAPRPPHADPWIGVRSWWRNTAAFRNVQITGSPEIPEAVLMSGLEDLAGWLPYFDETVGYEGADWQWRPDPESSGQIVGRRREELEETFCESLLRYHRPLTANDSVEYEFYYEPGKAIVHPALDRLALVLDSGGVRIHWITDGKYDRTGAPPDNLLDEPRSRRGPRQLPLRPGEWNRVALSLAGAAITLKLNGQTVLHRELESANQRTFGLFYYAGDNEARVRDVVMHGDWPKSLPPASEQEFFDIKVASLNADLARLKSVFTHDFTADGVPDRFFELRAKNPRARVAQTDDGFHTAISSPGSWSQVTIVPRFALQGDFDVEARFDRFDVNVTEKEAFIQLAVGIQDARKHQARIVRGRNNEGRQFMKGQLVVSFPDGTHRYLDTLGTDESASGRLRIARRGREIYTLYAEEDSTAFRLVGQETATDSEVAGEGVQLVVVANGVGRASVVWKDVTLRSERLVSTPPAAPPVPAVKTPPKSVLESIFELFPK